ncbi:MAG: hypothetical protein IKU29_07030 [Parabacteroides sp.]|nr:hypothetical protein [Parabacteroides sp.]
MSREDFLNEVDRLLVSMGFIKKDDYWECIRQTTQQTQQIIVNGQVMNSPPVQITNIFQISDMGVGYITNSDDSNQYIFEQFHYKIFQNNVEIYSMMECVNLEDSPEVVIDILKSIRA